MVHSFSTGSCFCRPLVYPQQQRLVAVAVVRPWRQSLKKRHQQTNMWLPFQHWTGSRRAGGSAIWKIQRTPLLIVPCPVLSIHPLLLRPSNRALSLCELGQYSEALRDFDRAVENESLGWRVLWNRAVCLAEIGVDQNERAKMDLERCKSLAAREGDDKPAVSLFHVCPHTRG